jgi:hypothetical protein
MDRIILVASFIQPNELDWFLSILSTDFNINKDNVFFYKNLDDDTKIIVTFKLILFNGEKINLKEFFPNATIINKRGDALFTINALNNLIEFECGLENGNIKHHNHQIDWSKYQHQMILTNKSNLVFINIERIFL